MKRLYYIVSIVVMMLLRLTPEELAQEVVLNLNEELAIKAYK